MCKIQRSACNDTCLSPMMHCAFSLATDHLGCEICSCKMPVASGLILAPDTKPRDCVALSTQSCDLTCDHGYRTDQHGCEICHCMNQSDECPSMVSCRLQSRCPYGLASDQHGCPKCACKHPGVCDPLPSYCDLECERGYSTDKFGCEQCLCKKAEDCPDLQSCQLTCPFGLATCPCRCEICKCKLPNSYTLHVLSDLTAVPIWNESKETDISNSVVCPELNCLEACHFGYAVDPISGCQSCHCKTRLRCPSLLEPMVAMETQCESNADCRNPHQLCCFTGTRFMCMDALDDSCTDDYGRVHSHGEVWHEDCDTQCSCFHGNIRHIHFQIPSIPEGCQYEVTPGHCYYSYTCVNGTCQDTENSWSIDECTQCSCRLEDVTPVCTRLPCPKVPKGCHVAAVEDSCCPDIVCPGCRDAGGHLKVEGQMWNDNLCTSCVCEEGQRSCRRMTCEIPRPECQQIYLPNQCCPKTICPGDFKRPCEAIRSLRNPLQLLDDSPTRQPGPYIPSCVPESGYFNATQCYPAEGLCWCADHLGTEVPGTRTRNGIPNCRDYGCVDLQGNYHRENDTWNRDQCTTCQCIQGILVCRGPRCRSPPRGCDVFEERENCECPRFICTGFCFDDRHSIRRIGELWHTPDCTRSCECGTNGVITCQDTACQEPLLIPDGCFHEKRSPDDCCPSVVVCHDDLSSCPAGTPAASCFSDPCLDATCYTHPNAICHANFCGGCNAIFYDDQNTGPIQCRRQADSPYRVHQYGTHNISCHALLEQTTPSDTAYYPRCTGHDTYSAKQCDTLGSCWCVNPDGVHIADSGMAADSTELCIAAPCRQELESNREKFELGQTVTSNPSCDLQGMYLPQQCTIDGTQCWCTEPDGTMIPNTKTQSGGSVTCLAACGNRQALTTQSCNSVIPCPPNYTCHFMTPSNHGVCCRPS
ncbi:kielin/chordin-like protein [Lytechinus variegatus]|uniref:kielin/chordin-like protein n=1 Tax=Lytechinus variegatus TaxID=7654 RepID=UPI001BB1BEC2|nr:kielin/chordin-like protein [Lytechinus variegatus]